MGSGKKGIIRSGLIWAFGERIMAQLVTTLVTIILARILDPEHYGIISIVMVFIAVCNVFVVSGLGTALVQKKDVDELDFNTAFSISIAMSVLLYLILFFGAPFIAGFYEMSELVDVIRVMGIRLPIAAINSVQQARIQREMAFKRFFVATLFGTVLSGIVGIIMAIAGFGVWALVAQYLTNTTVDTVVLGIVEKWMPKIHFSHQKAKCIYSFGWKVLATELTYTIGNDLRSLIIGKVFGSEDLAYYDQGKKYPSLIVQNVNASINKVMLPAYSKKQETIDELRVLLRKSIRVGMYIMAPMLVGLAATSKVFVPLVLTEKWNSCIPFLQIMCISYITRPLESSCHQALLGIGKSVIVLKVMIAIQLVDALFVVIVVLVFKSVLMMAIATLVTALFSLVAFLYSAYRLIGYKIKDQLIDIMPILIICILMGIIVMFVGEWMVDCGINLLFCLVVQVVVGMSFYFVISSIAKFEGYNYIISFLKGLLVKKSKEI